MYKLVILIERLDDWQAFEENWPEFLHQAERMPGLRSETTGRVERFVFGDIPYAQMHELYFDSLQDLERAMASPQGREAGRLLQQMTAGRLTLFFADHKEDDLKNIRAYW